jgi:hypothetical protein
MTTATSDVAYDMLIADALRVRRSDVRIASSESHAAVAVAVA